MPLFGPPSGGMMHKILPFLIVILAVALPGAAQLSDQNRGWADGPVGYLLTTGEKEAWEAIADDEDATRFIDLFWARRDPDLRTRENEFRLQFEARVEAADAEFAEDKNRGAMTDRGKTLILLGVPAEHGRSQIGDYLAQIYRTGRPPQASSSDRDAQIQMQGVSFKLHQGRADLWGYTPDQLPAGIEWRQKADLVSFAFFDHDGTGLYRLQLGIRKSAESKAVLAAAAQALLLHPDMQDLPVFGLFPDFPAASPAELEWLESDVRIDSAVAVFEPGVGGGWLNVRLPADVPAGDAIVGRLSAADEALGTFKAPVEPLASTLGAMYEMTVPAPTGASILEIVVANAEGPIHTERLDIEREPEDAVFLTPVFAGAEVDQRVDAKVGDTFVFGGYHLAIRPDGRFRAGENLALFCILSATGDEASPRTGSVRMRWYIDGEATPNQPSQPIQFSPAGSGTWVWGTQLPLNNLAQDHEYELKISVRDAESNVSRTSRIPILFVAD